MDALEAVWGVQLCLLLAYIQKSTDERAWWLMLSVNLTGPQDAQILVIDTICFPHFQAFDSKLELYHGSPGALLVKCLSCKPENRS